jgi:hypothetical protein
MLNSEATLVDWVTLNPGNDDRNRPRPSPVNTAIATPESLIEANGWMLDNEGQVVLTANSPATHSPWSKSAACGTTPHS